MMMKRDRLLWLSAAAGPLVWFVLLFAAYSVTPPAHMMGRVMTLRLLHLGALMVTLAAAAIAVRELDGARKNERARFMATGALALSALSVALVIASAIPTLMLVPGAEP